MARVCYVILVHHEPVNLLGLIGSLWNPEDAFLVWVDGKADQQFFECARAASQFGDNVQIRTGSPMVWGGFSIVETTLTAYSKLRAQVGRFSHVVLCSGTHIPLLHPDAIYERIRNLPGWMDIVEAKVPEGGLRQADGLPDGWWRHMMRRIRYRYVEVPAMGMIVEGDRAAWNGTALLEGSQWHVLRSDLFTFILEHQERIRETFHNVVVADEHAFQWIVAQWPSVSEVRRGDSVWMEWMGASPRRVSFTEAAEKASKSNFLFVRKAAPDSTIDGWENWAGDVLCNHPGAKLLLRVAAALTGSFTSAQKIDSQLPIAFDGFLKSLALAVSQATYRDVKLDSLNSRLYLISTERHVGRHGPVYLLCDAQSKVGIAVVPIIRRPPKTAVDDPLLLQPGLPGMPMLSDFVNLPIDGRAYWMITETDAGRDIENIIKDIFAESQGSCEPKLKGISGSRPTRLSLSLACGDGSLVDLSLHKRATQSSLSQYSVGATVEEDASRAVTLDPLTPYAFHTCHEDSPWWKVDLEDICRVQQVVVVNRSETDYLAQRAAPLLASASLDGLRWTPLFVTEDGFIPGRGGKPFVWTAAELVDARFVRLSIVRSSCLHLRQVRVLGFRNRCS